MGQLRLLIRGKYLVDAVGFNKVQGKPFLISELAERMERLLDEE
jgi:2-oxoglutarate ferredoxin oxidoreductase subunit alpha